MYLIIIVILILVLILILILIVIFSAKVTHVFRASGPKQRQRDECPVGGAPIGAAAMFRHTRAFIAGPGEWAFIKGGCSRRGVQ